MLTCEIDGEVTVFLHNGLLWDNNIQDLDVDIYLQLSANVTLVDYWKDMFQFSFTFELA